MREAGGGADGLSSTHRDSGDFRKIRKKNKKNKNKKFRISIIIYRKTIKITVRIIFDNFFRNNLDMSFFLLIFAPEILHTIGTVYWLVQLSA